MRVLKRRMIILSVLFGLFLLAAVFFFLLVKNTDFPGEKIMLPVSVTGMCLGIAGICLEKKKLKEAKLIIENRILYEKSTDVSISCFGIFMDARVIPFNQKGIRLNSVTLANDCITLTYGTKKKNHRVSAIFKTPMDTEELQRIAEIFRYETGVSPTIEEQSFLP